MIPVSPDYWMTKTLNNNVAGGDTKLLATHEATLCSSMNEQNREL